MVKLVVESWIWWSIVIIVAASRFVSRRMTLGSFQRYQPDDWLMFFILAFYTTSIVTINIVRYSDSNLIPPGTDVDAFTQQDIDDRIYGSKLILVVEQCQCVTVWGAKACLLILYHRLTTLRRENIAIKVLAGYVAFGFVFMEIFYFGVWCRPFHNYWAVPTPSVQCDAATNHLITNAVFNLSSDLIMLVTGLPMFLRMRLPLKKKIPLVGIFSLGIFVVLAAILNKVYSFTQPFGSLWTYWYVRESSTALLVANLPFVWTVWRKITGMHSSTGDTPGHSTYAHTNTHNGLSRVETRRKEGSGGSPDEGGGDVEMGDGPGPDLSLHDMLNDTSTLVDTKEATPFTHPHLFYGHHFEAARAKKPDANSDMTASWDKDENSQSLTDPTRESSSAHGSRAPDTPTARTFPQSTRSEKSAGSFV